MRMWLEGGKTRATRDSVYRNGLFGELSTSSSYNLRRNRIRITGYAKIKDPCTAILEKRSAEEKGKEKVCNDACASSIRFDFDV